MPSRIPPIREFPKDGRIWRIDWLGPVERAPAEARIDVHFSPARPGVAHPREQKQFDGDAATRVRIGVGLLPFLAIGSLWRDGCRLRQTAGSHRELPNVRIDPQAIGAAIAGTLLQEAPPRWLIPKFAHQFPKAAWFSPRFSIEYGGNPYGIVLPVIEAIRFYYAVSTDLAHIAFNGAFQLHLNGIVDVESSINGPLRGSDRMVLRLRQWLADDDGWVIGRVLADRHAREGVSRIYDSLLRNSANRAVSFPECGLPFRGTTTWSTRGVEIPVDGGGKRWLIHELTGCTGPFPFEELEIVRDNDGRGADDPDAGLADDEKQPAWTPPRRSAKLDADAETQSDDAPQADIDPVRIPLASERFGALRGKEIIETPKDRCRYKKSSFRRAQIVALLGSGVAGGEETGVAPLRADWKREVERRTRLPASFEALQAVVDALNARSGVSARVRPLTAGIEFLPRTKPSNQWQWAYLDSASKTRRRVMAVDVECLGAWGSLVEFERRKNERSRAALLIPLEPELSDPRLERLLAALVAAEGIWANLKPRPADVRLELFNHSRTSADGFAADICAALRPAN